MKGTKPSGSADRLPSRLVYWLLGSMVYTVLPLIFFLSIWVVAFAAAVFAWRGWIELRNRPIPSIWPRVFLMLVLILGLLIEQQTILGRDAGSALLVGLLSIKLLEVKTSRDYVIAAYSSYILILSNLLFSQSVLMFGYMLTALTVVSTALMKGQIGPESSNSFRMLSRPALRLLFQAVPIAAVLFFFFPRLQSQGIFQIQKNTSGLSEVMKPGDISDMSLDQTIAFRVNFPNKETVAASDLYWRGFILWDTDGKEWRIKHPAPIRNRASLQTHGKPIVQEITLMPHTQHWLFALDYPLNTPQRSRMFAGQIIQSQSRIYSKFAYEVSSDLQSTPQEGSEEILYRCIQLPKTIHPEIVQFVQDLKSRATSSDDFVRLVLQHFQQGGFTYTTQPGRYGEDPVHEFLFKRKQGFCEHYAGAFALLMRLANIPSRVVSGYQGGEYNSYGGFWVIRQANAHAWCEVWLQGRGWIRVDPTSVVSPNRIQQGIEAIFEQQNTPEGLLANQQNPNRKDWRPEWLKKASKEVRMRRDQVDYTWDGWMLDFNSDGQKEFFSQINITRTGSMLLIAITIPLIVILLWGIQALWLKRKISEEPIQDLYLSFCDRLAASGMNRESCEGPIDFTRRAAHRFPSEKHTLEEIGWLYASLRYGQIQSQKHLVDQLSDKIGNLELRDPASMKS
jgi:protein-glutamine gamma-glutamyltransferase